MGDSGVADSETVVATSTGARKRGAIGKYQLLFELGRGGMANVYLAVVRGPGGFSKLQVIKVLRPELASDPEFLTMFSQEARLSAHINHPNVAQTQEVGEDGNNHFIAMEYLDGQSLEAVFRRSETSGGMPVEMSIRVLADALVGLHYAHELTDFQGKPLEVVHRDVSPHNIFVTYDGLVKVVDFGIAKAANSQIETRSGVIKGKVGYMAPEQIGACKDIDRRVDVFAAGAILWRAIVGKRLWKDVGDFEIFRQLVNHQLPTPSATKPDVDPELERICLKALAATREERYASAAEMRAELEAWLQRHNHHTTGRDVGKYVADLFADRRSLSRQRIETRMLEVERQSFERHSASVPALISALSSASDTPVPHSAATEGVTAPAAPPRRRRSVTVAAFGIGALAALIGVVMFIMRAQSTKDVAAATTVEPATTTAAPLPLTPGADTSARPKEPAAETTVVTFHSTPSAARLSVDDVALGANRTSAQYPRDNATHRLKAEAPGFVARVEQVTFDAPAIDIDIALEKQGTDKPSAPAGRAFRASPPPPAPPPPLTSTAAAAAPPPPPVPSPASTPTSTKPPKAVLDKDDPWKK